MPVSATTKLPQDAASADRVGGRLAAGLHLLEPAAGTRHTVQLLVSDARARDYLDQYLADAARAVEAEKHPQEGAGIITSLTETDGLVELAENATSVAPGAMVGFLSYAALIA